MQTFKMALLGAASLSLAACGAGGNGTKAQATDQVSTDTSPAVGAQYELVEIASGFDMPWGIAFLPEGGFLVSQREGLVSYVAPGANIGAEIAGGPEALISGQGGYLGIALDPGFQENRLVYLAYSKGTKSENSTAVMKARLSEDHSSFENAEDIFVAPTMRATSAHFGGRLLFLPDGTLLISLGDGFRYMDEAQNPQNSHGTIFRINTDGSFPADNPFADGEGGLPGVFSYGHRNVQGLAYDPASDTIYEHEHGPKGGDEINILEPGLNYGWPKITYGVNYDGSIITRDTEAPGMEQPIVKWVPSIAPSGMVFYTGDRYPEWDGDLLVTALAGMKIQRVDLDKGRVKGEEALFEDAGFRFRHIALGPDGYLYVLPDDIEAPIFRIEAAAQ